MTTYQWRNPGCVTREGMIEVEPVKGGVAMRLPDALGGARMTPDQARAVAGKLTDAARRAEGKA